MSGFAAGTNKEVIGHALYYTDYNTNPFVFYIGFEHYQTYVKNVRKVALMA